MPITLCIIFMHHMPISLHAVCCGTCRYTILCIHHTHVPVHSILCTILTTCTPVYSISHIHYSTCTLAYVHHMYANLHPMHVPTCVQCMCHLIHPNACQLVPHMCLIWAPTCALYVHYLICTICALPYVHWATGSYAVLYSTLVSINFIWT